MKRILSLILALLLQGLPATAASVEPVLLADGPRLILRGAQTQPGEVRLTVACAPEETLAPLYLLEPRINGAPASFGSGWGSELLDPAEASGGELEIRLLADDPRELPETISLRFLLEGRISSRLELSWQEGDQTLRPASLARGEAEPPLLSDRIACDPADVGEPMLLRDRVDPALVPQIYEVRAFVCLPASDGEGAPLYREVCTLEPEIDESGAVTARYSGLCLRLADDPTELLPSREKTGEEGIIRIDSVSFSGESVFMAGLRAELLCSSGRLRFGARGMESSELGGNCGMLPVSMFDSAVVLCRFWRTGEGDGALWLEDETQMNHLSLSQPLRLEAVPLASLGPGRVFFRYYLEDGGAIYHPYEMGRDET